MEAIAFLLYFSLRSRHKTSSLVADQMLLRQYPLCRLPPSGRSKVLLHLRPCVTDVPRRRSCKVKANTVQTIQRCVVAQLVSQLALNAVGRAAPVRQTMNADNFVDTSKSMVVSYSIAGGFEL